MVYVSYVFRRTFIRIVTQRTFHQALDHRTNTFNSITKGRRIDYEKSPNFF